MISVKNLIHSYIQCTMHEPINFEIQSGMMGIVTGKNGSGKTTLLKILSGLIEPFSGEINIPNIFYNGHERGLKQELSVIDNLTFRQKLLNPKNKHLDKALELFNLKPFIHYKVEELSQGRQQQVALTSAWLSERSVWLLDEPFAHLDSESSQITKQIFNNFLKNDGTVMITTHQLINGLLPYKEIKL